MTDRTVVPVCNCKAHDGDHVHLPIAAYGQPANTCRCGHLHFADSDGEDAGCKAQYCQCTRWRGEDES